MQPQHALPESSTADTWRSVLSPDVAATGWRIGSLLRSGARLAFGSDWPVVPYDPLLELHAAVTRQTADGAPADGWLPDERVSLEEALLAATAGSAFAGHADGDRGHLTAGMLADLIVLDRDLLAEGPSAITGTRVVATIVDGTVVHRRG
jgi:predicted amidohydrolase YtcJ